MENDVIREIKKADVLIMCAAVADYTPLESKDTKEPRNSQSDKLNIKVRQTTDIAARVGKLRTKPLLVGFAAETHDVLIKAAAKLKRKNLDIIVANKVGVPDSGFEVDTNEVTILDATGTTEELPLMPKEEVAEAVLTHIAQSLNESGKKKTSARKKAAKKTTGNKK